MNMRLLSYGAMCNMGNTFKVSHILQFLHDSLGEYI